MSIAETRAMLRSAGSRTKHVVVRPAGSGHGIELLLTADQQRTSPLWPRLVAFVRTPA